MTSSLPSFADQSAIAAGPGRRQISLAHLSMIACDPVELLRVAAGAGFDLVDVRLSPATPTDRIYSPAERFAWCRQMLPLMRDTGLRVWDVEIVRVDAKTQMQDHLPLLEAAALLGAQRIKVVADSDDEGLVAGHLAEMCQLAAPLGLTIDLEYMVFSGLKSLAAALRVVHTASQPNLKVLIDALHWMRAGDTPEQIRAATPAHLGYVQLCDGPLRGPAGRDALILEARTSRLPPGEGAFPLQSLLRAMPDACVASLEVPLPPGRDATAHARRLFSATHQLLRAQQEATRP